MRSKATEATVTPTYYPLRTLEVVLKVSRWTLYRWLKAGQLHGTKVGRQYRVPASELNRILGEGARENDGDTDHGRG